MQPFDTAAPNHYNQQGIPVYNHGLQNAQNTAQRHLIAQQLKDNIRAPGQGLVILFSLIAIVGSIAVAFIVLQASYYDTLIQFYKTFGGTNFSPEEFFKMGSNSCKTYLIGSLGLPAFLGIFAVFNFLAMLFACCGTSCCMCFQALMALIWGGLAAFITQQKCSVTDGLTLFIGSDNVPQNPWPCFAGLAGATLALCVLNYCWSSNKDNAERDQKNLALMMSA